MNLEESWILNELQLIKIKIKRILEKLLKLKKEERLKIKNLDSRINNNNNRIYNKTLILIH